MKWNAPVSNRLRAPFSGKLTSLFSVGVHCWTIKTQQSRCLIFDAVSYKRRVWPERRPASPNTKDALTGEYHETKVADLALAAKVADALDNIDRYLRSTGG
jgi:hypothetical protein